MSPIAGRIVIIANPMSGRGRCAGMLDSVVEQLRGQGIGVTVVRTDRSGDAEWLAAEAACDESDRPRCVAGCGGDGTIQEVASALAKLRNMLGDRCPALGLVPVGRCNDLARVLGLSPSIPAIVDVLAHGQPVPLDLGRINERYFCTVATMGFDAAVSRYVDQMQNPLSGTPAYLYGAARVLMSYRPPTVTLEGDFGRFSGEIFLASTANTATYGGSIPIAPGADPTDGWLDLCVIHSENAPKRQLLPLLAKVLQGRHVGHPAVRLVRTRRVRIESQSLQELWADGECVANTPATIEVVPRAIRVMLPRG